MKSFKKLALTAMMTGVLAITAACGAQGTEGKDDPTATLTSG